MERQTSYFFILSLSIHSFLGLFVIWGSLFHLHIAPKHGAYNLEVSYLPVGPKSSSSFDSLSVSKSKTAPSLKASSSPKTVQLKSEDSVSVPSSKDQVASEASEVGRVGGGSQSSGSDSVLANYLWEVRHVIEKKKSYPTLAKRLSQEGVVDTVFILNREGRVIEIESLGSQHEALASSVRNLLKSENLFPSFPVELQADTLRVSIPVRFVLK